MGKKMKNAPVYFTIAQVRHNPILSMGNYLPQIQESMRKVGYPDFERRVTIALNFYAAAPNAETKDAKESMPSWQQVERFTFSNADRTKTFLVEPSALSFQSTDYGTFETFSEEFFKGMAIIHDAVSLAYAERVGIRYLDAVVPKEGEKGLPKYLVPQVLGLADKLPDAINVTHSFTETHFQAKTGRVLARTMIQNGPLGFPMDLQPVGMALAPKFSGVKGVHAILDTDASYEVRQDFDMAKLSECLKGLHDDIRVAFDATVTPHALKTWNRKISGEINVRRRP